jgi:hypothetical protein
MSAPFDRGDGVEPLLAWVIVDGLPRHVSEFATLKVRQRPPAFCHVCGEGLILKLGAVRRHHAAHRAGATCPATRPETALHSDCKLALAAALLAAASPTASLTFRVTCSGDEHTSCERTLLRQWTGGWDEVRIERRVDAASQPDITLLRAGVVIGVLEVVVNLVRSTHWLDSAFRGRRSTRIRSGAPRPRGTSTSRSTRAASTIRSHGAARYTRRRSPREPRPVRCTRAHRRNVRARQHFARRASSTCIIAVGVMSVSSIAFSKISSGKAPRACCV